MRYVLCCTLSLAHVTRSANPSKNKPNVILNRVPYICQSLHLKTLLLLLLVCKRGHVKLSTRSITIARTVED